MQFNGEVVSDWEADEVPANSELDDTLKPDLLGARRKILFVEGTENSLDKPLYSLIFPMVSVIPKGSCRAVEQATAGSRAVEDFHWLLAFGIADGDGFTTEQISEKREKGVYVLPFYSVEAIYFHPRMIEWIAERCATAFGGNAVELNQSAIAAGVAAVSMHTERLSQNVAKKAVRNLIVEQIPNDDVLLAGQQVVIENNAAEICAERKALLDLAVESGDWEKILISCPVRESSALADIATTLGFQRVKDYHKAVRHLLTEDEGPLQFVRGLFDDLFEQLN
jgi:hypothetical protein